MQLGRIDNDLDIGFTDLLLPEGGVAHPGQLATSMDGTSFVATLTAGVVWCPDHSGSVSGIVNSLVRCVYAGGTVTLAANADAALWRVDLIVATVGAGWGLPPTIAVRQGTPALEVDFGGSGGGKLHPDVNNCMGAAAPSAGDVLLCAVALAPKSVLPVAFSGDGSLGDLRRLAADRTPPGIVKSFDGAVPPVGYKWHDGAAYSKAVFASLSAALGTVQGSGPSGTFHIGDSRGRVDVGADSMGIMGAAGRVSGASISKVGGEEKHTLNEGEIPAHSHSISPYANGSGGNAGFSWTTAPGLNGNPLTPHGTEATGGGQGHNNMQPYQVRAKVIKF